MGAAFQIPEFAFAPFYDTPVAFAATRGDGTHRGTVAVCILDEGWAEVVDEVNGTSSRIRQLSFEVPVTEWNAALSTPPQAGDVFTSPTTARDYAVTEVAPSACKAWAITAREDAAR